MTIMQNKPATTAEAIEAMHLTICKIVHKYLRNHRGDFEDLYQRGAEGVLRAYLNFDDSKDCSFSTYAYPWIWALVKDTAKENWAQYNAKAPGDFDTLIGDAAYTMDIVDDIDMSRKLDKLDDTTRDIVVARHEGYTFREIAEGLTQLGEPCTLHQVRNRYLDAVRG